jgi:RNA polymerase sigma-70 factor (ECF subfamily)
MCASLALVASVRPTVRVGRAADFAGSGPKGARALTDGRQRPRAADPWSALIIAVAERQDRTAFTDLFNHFAPRVKAYLVRNGAGEAQAEEIAQEALLTVWRKAALFDASAASASTWIFTIARNLRIDAARREKRGGAIRVDEAEAEFETDDAPLPDARLAAAEAEARVRAALAALSNEQREVVRMSYFDDRAHAEIAERLKIPLGTVKSRLRLALNRLRGLMDEDK